MQRPLTKAKNDAKLMTRGQRGMKSIFQILDEN